MLGADPTENPDGKASLVETNDTRMNQVVYADGHCGRDSTSRPCARTGIAYFIVTPSVGGSGVQASITKQDTSPPPTPTSRSHRSASTTLATASSPSR